MILVQRAANARRMVQMRYSEYSDRAPLEEPLTASRQLVGLVAWLAVSLVAGGLGAVASAQAADFYRELSLPEWAPAASLFGPVWTVLYVMMGVAAWLVWRTGGFKRSGGALPLFVVQLGVNALWTWLFFRWRLGEWAFAEILLLWTMIAGTVVLFWRVRPLAGLLMLPYLGWVTFATALCHAVWRMNPDLLG